MLTTSPATIPSPALGTRAHRTSASPVLTAIRTSSSLLLAGPVADRECRAHGALRVVLVRDRRAEHGHDRVADELLDRAAVSLELLAHAREIRREQGAHVLGIELLGSRVEPTRSRQNTMLTTLRSSRAGAAAARAVPHSEQGLRCRCVLRTRSCGQTVMRHTASSLRVFENVGGRADRAPEDERPLELRLARSVVCRRETLAGPAAAARPPRVLVRSSNRTYPRPG